MPHKKEIVGKGVNSKLSTTKQFSKLGTKRKEGSMRGGEIRWVEREKGEEEEIGTAVEKNKIRR